MFRKLLGCLVIILFISLGINARAKYFDYVRVGGKDVKTSSVISYKLMETFPNSTVTVYLTGTTTLATIYSDNSGTIKVNPFTADSKAYYEFYADNGVYDIKFSGTGITSPFTKSNIRLFDPTGISFPPSGSAGGDLLGSYPNPTVIPKGCIKVSTLATSGNGLIGTPYLGWRSFLNSGKCYYFDSGIDNVHGHYSSTASNLGIKDIKLIGDGSWKSFIHLIGSGNVLDFDDNVGETNTNIQIIGLSIRGTASATDGIFIRSMHHVFIQDVDVWQVAGACLHTKFSVGGDLINFRCSVNEGAGGQVPTNGLILDKRNTNEATASWNVQRVFIEGVSGVGIDCVVCLNTHFNTGTSEGNGGIGVKTQLVSINTIYTLIHTEANGGNDFEDSGTGTYLNHCYSSGVAQFNIQANNPVIDGGVYNTINQVPAGLTIKGHPYYNISNTGVLNVGGGLEVETPFIDIQTMLPNTYFGEIAPTLTNSWATVTGQEVGYRRAFGKTFVIGAIKDGTNATSAFIINTGYKPIKKSIFVVKAGTGFGTATFNTDGTVVISVGTGTNTEVNLDGISFIAKGN